MKVKIKKICLVNFIFPLLCLLILSCASSSASCTTKHNVSPGLEIPLCKSTQALKNGHDHEVHSYNGFTLCYRESYECAEWVCYTLTAEEVDGTFPRSNDFREDLNISTGSASLNDYRRSGYDRGHLAPAGDMKWSEGSMSDTFLLSNITPQRHSFNDGIWKQLEEQVRRWAKKYGEVVVITGPVLEKKSSAYPRIGENAVAVPEFFYKVLYALNADGEEMTLAFIIPQENFSGSIYDYAVTVDEVEKRTGLDFFVSLDDEKESLLESEVNASAWRKRNSPR